MSEPISRERLVERLAEVSHATWLVQGVRDGRRALVDPYGGTAHAEGDVAFSDDVNAAKELLAQVMNGESLQVISENHRHWPSDHDRERAEMVVLELERLGVFSRRSRP